MRKQLIVLLALAVVGLQGCIVKSVHQFYTDKDVILQQSLEGTWQDLENQEWTIHKNPFGKNYELHCSKNGRDVALLGTLFTLGGNTYIDIIPIQDNSEEVLVFDLHMVPTHSIAKVSIVNDDEVNIYWFNEEWLRDMFTHNKIRIAHEFVADQQPKSNDDRFYLLTAATSELQKFVLKYGNDEKAYDEADLSLKLKRIN
jgi:hypothetical protein